MNRDSSSNCINAIYFSVPITLSAYPNFIAFVEPTVYVDVILLYHSFIIHLN